MKTERANIRRGEEPSVPVRRRLAWARAALAIALVLPTALGTPTSSAATLTWNTTTGTWDLTALNWAPGPVAWTQTGTTSASNDAVFGGSDGTYTVTLGSTQIAASNLTFNASGYTLASGSLWLGSGTVSVASGKSATISSVVRGTSGLAKTGAGSLTLSGANTFSGGITLNSGTLLVGSVGAAGSANILTINGGAIGSTATVNFNNTSNISSVNISGDFTAAVGASTQLTFTSTPIVLVGGTRTITVNGGLGFNLYGGIGDGGNGYGLIKTGNALMRLGGVNTYSGDTRVNGNTLSVWTEFALQNSAVDVDGAGTFAWNQSANYVIGGLKGAANLAPSSTGGALRTFSINPGATVRNVYSGALANTTSGTLGIIMIGSGTQVFTGVNTYTGTTDIRAGTLQLGNAGSAGALSLSSVITGSTGGTLAFNRTNTVTQGTHFNSVIGGGIHVAQLGSGTLILNGANTYTGTTRVTAGTVLAGNVNAFGTGSIDLAGEATLDLNGLAVANAITNNGGTARGLASYAGTQTVLGPTSLTGTVGGTVIVGTGGTLKGSNTSFAGAVIIAEDGIHSPGNSPGVQSFESGISYDAGSTLLWELVANTTSGAGTAFDIVNVTGGDLSIADGALLQLEFQSTGLVSSTVDWSDAFWDVGQSWTIIDFSSGGTSTGNFTLVGSAASWLDSTGASLASARNGTASFQVNTVNGDVVLSYVIVPEPDTIIFAGIGIAMAAWSLRKRRRDVQPLQ